MNNEWEEILAKAGMKKKDAAILIKLAKLKKISLSRAFFLYAWKYLLTFINIRVRANA